MTSDAVRNYYASFDQNEWDRLTTPGGAIEFAVTTHALGRHLPQKGRILALGGGPGRYSIWLAQRGYQVVLADISPNLLDIARDKIAKAGVQSQIEAVATCDACDLSPFDDNSFDSVVCLGPFYHLIEATDRKKAIRELVRVLKPDGIAFVAFMPIYTLLRRTLAHKDERHHLAQPAFVSGLMDKGVFSNDVPGRFTAGYGVKPNEVAPFMEQHGLQTIELLADTGFATGQSEQLAELKESNPSAYDSTMDIILSTANDPSLLGGSTHLLYVGRKVAQVID